MNPIFAGYFPRRNELPSGLAALPFPEEAAFCVGAAADHHSMKMAAFLMRGNGTDRRMNGWTVSERCSRKRNQRREQDYENT
jgi:hypothetical protein